MSKVGTALSLELSSLASLLADEDDSSSAAAEELLEETASADLEFSADEVRPLMLRTMMATHTAATIRAMVITPTAMFRAEAFRFPITIREGLYVVLIGSA